MTADEFLVAARLLLERSRADEVFLHDAEGAIFAVLLPLRTYTDHVTDTAYHLRAHHSHLEPGEEMPR